MLQNLHPEIIQVQGRPETRIPRTPNPAERVAAIESLPLINLSGLYDISPDYHGPRSFQVWNEVVNNGIYPYTDLSTKRWNIDRGLSPSLKHLSWKMRYEDTPDNPVSANITGFVDMHPYPHEKNPLETDIDYTTNLECYQKTVAKELEYHIEKALDIAQRNPELGIPVFPLAFNGAKPVGHILTEKFGIPEEQLFTAQVKRVPLTDNSLVIAAGGLEYPQAVKEGKDVYPVFLDDCFATWATQQYLEELLLAGGANIKGRFFGAVIGTRHPFIRNFLRSTVPTDVSISQACRSLGTNAYLLKPDGGMQAGDMGLIINKTTGGNSIPHANWGATTKAHTCYK